MIRPGTGTHADHFSADRGTPRHRASLNTEIMQGGPAILLDERCSHAAEIAAEMQARNAVVIRAKSAVEQLSRASGIGFFTLCLSGIGWVIIDIL